jgi:hypothetical protein
VAVTWTDETGTPRSGRVRLAAQGLPVGWAVELLAAGATGAGLTVATDQVQLAQVPQVLTRPAGERKPDRADRVQLRTINDGRGKADA